MRNSVKHALMTAILAGPVFIASAAFAQDSSYDDLFGSALSADAKEKTNTSTSTQFFADDFDVGTNEQDFLITPEVQPFSLNAEPSSSKAGVNIYLENDVVATRSTVSASEVNLGALEKETNAILSSLSERLQGSGDETTADSLDGLDTLNRKKAILQQRNEIDALKLEALKSQVDMMLLLEATSAEIRKMRNVVVPAPPQVTQQNSTTASVYQEPRQVEDQSFDEVFAAEPQMDSDWPMLPDMPEIPRVAEVAGGAGEITAYGDYQDGRRLTMRQGDVLENGFIVREVRPTGVRLQWPPTGEIVFAALGPREIPPMQPNTFGTENMISLGTFGG